MPSRYLRKYSLPFAEEPNRLERHSVSIRGQFSGASTSSIENPDCSASELRARRRTPASGASSGIDRGVGSIGEVQRIDVELRVEGHPAHPRRLGDGVGGVHAGQVALGQRRGERVGGVAVEAYWSVCMYQYAVPIMVRGGRDQSRALASLSQPVIGRHFSWPT